MIATAMRHALHGEKRREFSNHEDVPVCRCRPGVVERVPPDMPTYQMTCKEWPLVSVLTPTTSERHWTHAHVYRCFDQQTWANKELVVLDTGDVPSPFFTSLQDERVRYTHMKLHDNVADLSTQLAAFVAAADAPPGGGRPSAAWSAAWRPLVAALADAQLGRDWFELEDERADGELYRQLVSRVVTLGSKRNWLASRARGTLLANFDDDDVYCAPYLQRLGTALLRHDAGLVKLCSFMHLDLSTRTAFHCDPDAYDDATGAWAQPGGGALSGADTASAPPRLNNHGTRWGFGHASGTLSRRM
jgi:hypothetical protein